MPAVAGAPVLHVPDGLEQRPRREPPVGHAQLWRAFQDHPVERVGQRELEEAGPAVTGAQARSGAGSGVDAGLLALLRGDRRRGAGQRVAAGGRLREGHDLADGVGAGEHRGEPVEPEGDAAVRRRAVLEGLEQEAELATAASSRESPIVSKTRCCISRWWIRIDPPPSSLPLSTTS